MCVLCHFECPEGMYREELVVSEVESMRRQTHVLDTISRKAKSLEQTPNGSLALLSGDC